MTTSIVWGGSETIARVGGKQRGAGEIEMKGDRLADLERSIAVHPQCHRPAGELGPDDRVGAHRLDDAHLAARGVMAVRRLADADMLGPHAEHGAAGRRWLGEAIG